VNTEREVPPYVHAAAVGRACKKSRRSAITELRGAGILERIGGHWKVGATMLRERLPGCYERVYRHFVILGLK
jgi:hypothetical protein